MNSHTWAFHTTFTLREAALALAGKERIDEQVKGVFRELRQSAESGEIPCRPEPAYRQVRCGFVRTTGERIPPEYEQTGATDWEKTTIARDDLKTWCENRKAYPPFLFPPQPQADPMTPKEEGTALTLVAALLAYEYGADWTERDLETFVSTLQEDLNKKGIVPSIKDARTWLKLLNKAAKKQTT